MKPVNLRGQATVEALITCSFVLIPLLLGQHLLARHLVFRHENQQAAHYLAWERTVWPLPGAAGRTGPEKPLAVLRNEVESRVWSEAETPFWPGHQLPEANLPMHPMLTVGPAQLDLRLQDEQDLRGTGAQEQEGMPGGGLTAHLEGLLSVLAEHTIDQNLNGYVRSSMHTPLRPLDSYSAFPAGWQEGTRLQSELLLLTDSWSSGSTEETRDIVENGLMPLQKMADFLHLESAVQALGYTGAILPWMSTLRAFDLTAVNPEAIPEQRQWQLR